MAINASVAFDGPVELVHAILTTAARQEKSTALKLIHVCKAARQWITPILYETVVLDNPSALRFESMLEMSSSSELAPFIKNLRATCLPDVTVLSKRCSKIRAMTLANYDVQHLNRLALPSLTHLVVSGFLRYSHFSPSMSVFATITHLRFPNDVPRLPEDLAVAMPNLTHFSCCYSLLKSSQHRELENCLCTVLAAPKLRVALVVVSHQTTTPGQVKDSGVVTNGELVSDPRVVVASNDELPGQWHNLSPTYDAIWAFADSKLHPPSVRLLQARATSHTSVL